MKVIPKKVGDIVKVKETGHIAIIVGINGIWNHLAPRPTDSSNFFTSFELEYFPYGDKKTNRIY